jgi:dipeptidyl aminopeptidase/acylaminoacyl peptidase
MWKVVGVAVVALVLCAGIGVALPRVAGNLPEPLSEVARVPERLWTRVFPPRVSRKARLESLTEPERQAVRTLGERLDGLIVWSSNRGGNHDLYLLDLRAQSVRRLTSHPHVDFFSRFSPDGTQVVFMRSQQPWVSFRDHDPWDLFLVNVDGTEERRIVRGGYHPTWTADGTAIVFQRGLQALRYDLRSGRETVLVDGPKDIPGITELGDPELSPDGRRLTLYPRGPLPGNAVFDLERRTLTPLGAMQACQPTWAPDGQRLVWIEIEGHGGTRVMTGRPDGTARSVLIDLPGKHSHEYFPKLSNDGRWLIWGASAEGHEHDRADYEIFVWEVGTPPESAVRLTHHEGNDQWPDLYVRRP